MTQYTNSTAKEWALDNLKGVCNVIMPSFRHDLSGLNEAAIRHDVRRNIELGFSGGLLVSEAGTTLDEMRRFMEVAVDNGGRLRQPAMKPADGQMRRAAEGLIKSGIVDGQPADLGAHFRGRVAD